MISENDYLNVWFGQKLVGNIWVEATGKIGFHYSKHWQADGFPISQQLPLNQQEYPTTSDKAQQFFANLLPEADARTQINTTGFN